MLWIVQINKWTVPSTSVASQVRSLRKGNNEQVAIAIDMDPGSIRLEDEDDDKGKLKTYVIPCFLFCSDKSSPSLDCL